MSPHEHPDSTSREFLLAFAILKKHGGFKDLTEEEYKIVSEAVLQFEQFKDIPVLFSNPSLLSRVIELLSIREFKAGTFIYEDGVHKDMKYFLIEGEAVYTRQNHILCMASQKQILFQKLEEKSQINASEDKKRAFQLIQGIKNHRNKPVKEIHLGQVFGSRRDYNNHLCFKSKRIEADYYKLQENLDSLQNLSVQAQSDCMVVCLPQRSYDYVFSAYVQKLSHLIEILCSNFRTIHIEDREHVGTEYFLHMCHDGIYQRKEIIIQQGTPTDYLYFVKSGNVQIQKSITELYQYGPNQYLLQKNFFNSKTYDHNAQATEPDTRITRISKPFIALLLNIKTLCPIKNIISKNSIISPNHMSPQTSSSTCSSLNKIQSQSSFQPSQQVLLQYAFSNPPSLSSQSSLQSFQSLRGIHCNTLDKPQNVPASLRDIQMPPDLMKLKNNSLSNIPNIHHSPVALANQDIGELENKQQNQQSMTESCGVSRKRRETSTCIENEKSSEDEGTTFKQFELSHPESVVSIVKGRHTLRRMNTTNYQTQNEPIVSAQKNDTPSSPPSCLSVNSTSIHKPTNIFLNTASNSDSAPRIEKRSSTFVHPKIMSFQNILPESYSNSPVLAPTSTFRSSSMNIAHQNSLNAAPKKLIATKTENSQILKLSGFKKFHEDQVKEQTAAHILFTTQTAKNHHSAQQCSLLSRRQLQLKALSSSQSSNSFQQLNQTPQEQIKQTPSPQIDPIWKQTHLKQGMSVLHVFNKH